MKRLVLLLSALAMFMAMTLPASAIKYGTEDTGNTFDGVGMLLFADEKSNLWVCSGTLIDPDSVLTAGHCTDGAVAAWASFSLNPLDEFRAALGIPTGAPPAIFGVPITYDGFSFTSFPNTGDVGVVNLLSSPGVATWPLADAGTLDGLATKRGVKNVSFDLVGYGTQATNGLGLEGNKNFDYFTECVDGDRPGCRQDTFLWARYFGTVKLTNLNSANTAGYNVQVSAAKGTGGALCFGDSGGPILYEGKIVAVNSFVLNLECAGAGFSYRVDREEILDWISDNT